MAHSNRTGPKPADEIMRSHAAVPLFSQDVNNDKPIKRDTLMRCNSLAFIVIKKGDRPREIAQSQQAVLDPFYLECAKLCGIESNDNCRTALSMDYTGNACQRIIARDANGKRKNKMVLTFEIAFACIDKKNKHSLTPHSSLHAYTTDASQDTCMHMLELWVRRIRRMHNDWKWKPAQMMMDGSLMEMNVQCTLSLFSVSPAKSQNNKKNKTFSTVRLHCFQSINRKGISYSFMG